MQLHHFLRAQAAVRGNRIQILAVSAAIADRNIMNPAQRAAFGRQAPQRLFHLPLQAAAADLRRVIQNQQRAEGRDHLADLSLQAGDILQRCHQRAYAPVGRFIDGTAKCHQQALIAHR